jgi:D-alanyl-D-alanine carboxypeptidase
MQRTKFIHFFLLVLIAGFLTGPKVLQALQKLTAEPSPSTQELRGQTNEPERPKISHQDQLAFQDLQLKAKSVFVWDISTHRKLFGYQEYEALPLASLTKVMTALIANESIPKDALISITREDLSLEGDSGLFMGERWSVKGLTDMLLVSSSNDAAGALARSSGITLIPNGNPTITGDRLYKMAFIDKMNSRSLEIGLINTRFKNESGLDETDGTAGAEGSARDMAILFEYLHRKHPGIIEPTASPSMTVVSESGISHMIQNTNVTANRIVGLIASKTGYTDLAGGNLVVLVDIGINHPIVIAVLGSTQEERFLDIEKLIIAATRSIAGDGERVNE